MSVSRLSVAFIACMRTLNIPLARNDAIPMARDVHAGNVAAMHGGYLTVALVACRHTRAIDRRLPSCLPVKSVIILPALHVGVQP